VNRLSRYDQGSAMPAGEGVQAEGVVKWFNSVKGFGFVAISNNAQDAFLHVSVVNRAGLQGLSENTRISCMVAPSQRGMQVTRIIEVLGMDENAGSQGGGRGNFGGGAHGGHGGGYMDGLNGGFDRGERHNGFDGGGSRETFGPETEVTGTVKWYKLDKGFGFAVPEDGTKDVFIHRSALARVGLDSIEPGRRIRMMVVNSSKGREASSISLMD
jgi:CspA family cold shock protein